MCDDANAKSASITIATIGFSLFTHILILSGQHLFNHFHKELLECENRRSDLHRREKAIGRLGQFQRNPCIPVPETKETARSPDGKKVEAELGGVLWIRCVDMK